VIRAQFTNSCTLTAAVSLQIVDDQSSSYTAAVVAAAERALTTSYYSIGGPPLPTAVAAQAYAEAKAAKAVHDQQVYH
jgi:glucan biosynthesis protein